MFMARDMGAAESLRVLRDPGSSTGEIFEAALAEVGESELVARVLENDPAWAYFAVLNVPELGERSEELRQRAASFEELTGSRSASGSELESLAVPEPDSTIPWEQIEAVQLSLVSGAGFMAKFSIRAWRDQSWQPVNAERDSPIKCVNEHWGATINWFDQPGFSFQSGDLVTMVVHQTSGSDWWPHYIYEYVPGNGKVAVTDTWGPAGSLKFSSSIQDWNPNS